MKITSVEKFENVGFIIYGIHCLISVPFVCTPQLPFNRHSGDVFNEIICVESSRM